jgi:diaminobutyrate-2-oxoglutarate transaminase
MTLDQLSLDAPKIVTPPPGPRARRLLDRQAQRESNARTYPRHIPLAVARAQGATIEDVDGNVYIDCLGGAGALNVGHSHPEVLAAVIKQMEQAIHTLDLPSPVKDTFTEQILSILPAPLQRNAKIQFSGPTGSDAIEGALKLVKTFTGRQAILAFQGSYHGVTGGALAVTGLRGPKEKIGTLVPDVHFLPYAYCYRCPLKLEPQSCDVACGTFAESVLTDPYSGVTKPAGIIVEAIQGEGGSIPAPARALQKLRALATAHEVPLIADEVQSGLGRTGKWFAFEHAGIVPDVIVMSKAIGGIGLPLAIIVYREELDTWSPGAHIGTFRGHLPAMAGGIAAIEIIRRDGLLSHATEIGEFLQAGFREIQAQYDIVGDVRGLGLMIGVEIIEGAGSLAPSPTKSLAIQRECFRRGLIIETGGRFDCVMRFLPPLVISRTLAQRIIDIFAEAVAAAATTAGAAKTRDKLVRVHAA